MPACAAPPCRRQVHARDVRRPGGRAGRRRDAALDCRRHRRRRIRHSDARRELRQPRLPHRGDAARAVSRRSKPRSAAGARVEERMMLNSTTTSGGAAFAEHIALNDVVVTKGARSRMIDFVGVGRRRVRHARQGRRVDRGDADRLHRLQPRRRRSDRVSPSMDARDPDADRARTRSTNRPIVIPAASPVRGPAADRRSRRGVRDLRRPGGVPAAGGRRDPHLPRGPDAAADPPVDAQLLRGACARN